MKIYITGNKLMNEDNLPHRILPMLMKQFPEISFEELDPSENMPDEELIIVDTIVGIEGVKVFTDLDSFSSQRIVSPHDYDLLFELRLNKKLGRLRNFTIIGLSPNMDDSQAFEKVKFEIRNLLKGS